MNDFGDKGFRGTGGRPRRKRAVILIIVLWIAVILSLLAYSVLFQMTMENKTASIRRKALRAHYLSRAGIADSFNDLKNDIIYDLAEDNESPFDAEGDPWALEKDNTEVEFGEGTYSIAVEDQDRYFNPNNFFPTNRLLLEAILKEVGMEEDEEVRIVASAIIDYADSDDTPSLDSAPGNEGLSYGMLRTEAEGGSTHRLDDIERMQFPDEPYMTVDALLDVFGVSPDLYFGPGSQEAQDYIDLYGDKYAGKFTVKEPRRRGRDKDEPPLGLRDFFSVDNGGRLNINTAPHHVLSALFTAAGRSDGERLAETIIRKRRGGSAKHIDNKSAFKSMQEVQEEGSLSEIFGAMSALYPIGVRSSTFVVQSTGYMGDIEQTSAVLVSRGMAVLQRDETFESIERAREREDRLEDRRERRQDKKNELITRVPTVRIIRWTDP